MGNARVTYSDGNNDGIITVADIKQINHYYPFGLNMEGNWNGAAGSNKYAYNGKEWNDDFGLGLNDYGARFYDAAIGRWNGIDLLAEIYDSYTPYNYVMNNPVNFFDPNGMIAEAVKPRQSQSFITNQLNALNGDYFADKYNSQRSSGNQSGDLGAKGIPNVAIHLVLKSQTKQIYQHTVDAIKDGHGFFFRFDPSKKNSLFRRSQALKGFVNNDPTKSLDEYPYASVKEGGAGASVRAVDIGEQLRQGGQWRGTTALLGDGDYILIIPFDDISGKVPIVVPIFARRFVKELFKTATEFIESISSKGLPALQRLITTPIIIPCVPCMERDILPWNKNTIEN